ncbi:DNA-binding protein [Roseibium album]|uniref:DNA-binding protein n=1 Tax=Roseibium album TaxID=311410 RepID=UPI00249024E4|nr:DNA-binding protein [Roseibium album]
MTEQKKHEPLGVIWGVAAIAQVIGRTPRQTYHALEKGALPAQKVAGRWCASRKKLEQLFEGEDAA